MTAPAYTLRPATTTDIDALYMIHRAGMRGYIEATYGVWDEDWQRRAFDAKYSGIWTAAAYTLEVVLVAGEIVGYLHCEREPGKVVLANIRVTPAWQRHGLGTALVEAVIASAAPLPVELHVMRVNPARVLYERLGFRVVAEDETHFHMLRAPDSWPPGTIAP